MTKLDSIVILAFMVAFLLPGCGKQNNETPLAEVAQRAEQAPATKLVSQNQAAPPLNENAGASGIAVEPVTKQSFSSSASDACVLPGRSSPVGLQMGGAIQCLSPSNAVVTLDKRTGSFAKFTHPGAITTDGHNLYVVDNDRIRKVALATGEVSTLAKLRGANERSVKPAAHGFPAITTDGNYLYIADQEHNEVRKVVIATGELTALTSFDDYTALQGITFDGKNIYALGVISIFKIDPVTGKVAQWKLKEGLGIKSMPISITTADRYLYVLSQADVNAGVVTGPEITRIETDTGHAATLTHVGNSIGWGAYLTTDGNYLYITNPDSRSVNQVNIASGEVTNFAGSGNSYTSADGIGDEATLLRPTGITSDGRNLYVSDSQSARIRKIEISNHLVTTVSGSTPGSSVDGIGLTGFDLPVEGMASDGKYLYVTDPSNSSIRRIELATNMVSTLIRGPTGGDAQGSAAWEHHLTHPKGLIAEAGSLYVADYSNYAIRMIEIATGKMTTLAGSNVKGMRDGTGPATSFNYPYGVASDGVNLYIADYNNHAIRKVEIATGKVTTLAGSGKEGSNNGVGKAASFAYPRGVAFDKGMLYVADYANNVVRQVEVSTGKMTLLAGSGQPGYRDGIGQDAMFRQPSDIVANGDKLYVADTYNNRIRQVEIATGKVTTLAGSGSEGNVDGIGVAASFGQPQALTIVNGKLYVADSAYHIIRSVDFATGAVETLELKGAPLIPSIK